MTPMILTADIGSSSLKAALIDLDGNLYAYSRAVYGRGKGRVSAPDWENAFFSAAGAIVTELKKNPDSNKKDFNFAAICVSGNGPTLVPVDRAGNSGEPLHWYDGRSVSSPPVCRSFFLPRAAWLKENSPAAYEATRYFVSSHEWLSFRLGAETVTSVPYGAYEPYYWDREQCAVFGVDIEKFPPITGMGTVTGKLSSSAAERLDIQAGIPIVSGAPDFVSALLGSGAVKPGLVCDRAGTSEGINVCVSSPPETKSFRALPHAIEGLWNLGAVLPVSGSLFEWFRELTGEKNRDYGELLEELIPACSQKESGVNTSRGDSSFLFYNSASVLKGGQNGLVISSPTMPGRVELGRMTLEAMGFSVRAVLGRLKDAGFPVKEMIVSGGQGKNPRWNQLKADITGAVLRVPLIADAELAGNAVLAAKALGKTRSIEEGVSSMIRAGEVFIPDEKSASYWEERFSIYTEKLENLISANSGKGKTN